MIISRDKMTLTSYDANDILGDCPSIDGDSSLYALVRAVALKYGQHPMSDLPSKASVARWRVRTTSECVDAFSDYMSHTVAIVECLGCFDEEWEHDDDWKSQLTFNGKPFPVNQYLSQFARTKIYVNEAKERLIAFVDRRTTHVWVQAFESVLCRLLSWYYPADLPDEEQKFYRAIAVDNKTVTPEDKISIFIKYVNDIASGIDFRAAKLHKLLDGVADRARQTKINSLKTSVTREREVITRLVRDLGLHYVSLDDKILELNALESAPAQTNDEMFNFFSKHKQVDVIDVNDNELRFGVKDTLEFYDEDEFERMLSIRSSFLHEFDDRTLAALRAIFLERRGVIRVNAMFELSQFRLVRPLQDYAYVNEAMPNPHIYFFGCSGGNDQYYTQYAESGDWDLGIEQAISATKNINWGDSTVCRKMISWLIRASVPCVYVADDWSPIDKVTNEMKLITFVEFMNKIAEEGVKENG